MVKEIIFKVDGMNCQHCVMSVQSALLSVKEVKKAKVDLKKAEAVIKLKTEVEVSILINAIKDAGFTATEKNKRI